jgi:DNA-binding LacI/PurR family transcriptional regulator
MLAVKRLGYQTNPFASALRMQRTGVIGVIIRDINDPFLSLMARELQRIAHAQGVELLMGFAEYDSETVRRQVNFMRHWFDGLLIIGDMPGDQAEFDDLRESGTSYVAVACAYAKYTGKLGVCLATSGSGGIHLLNGLYNAKLDGQPVLAITGHHFHDLIDTR